MEKYLILLSIAVLVGGLAVSVVYAKSVTTPEGLQIDTITEGTGPQPQKGQKVTVHYVGTLENGTKFDSSRDRGKPFDFTVGVGQVIPGWDKALMQMKVGEKAKLTIPPKLAYGSQSVGGVIPPNSTLIFEVELLGIK